MTVPFRQLWKEAARGKTVGRILINDVLRQWRDEVQGLVLDLACGQMPSYWRALGLKDNPRVWLVGVDHNAKFQPRVVANLKVSLPFRNSIADTVIISSFLYIVAEPKVLLEETRRVLKPNGMLLLTAPLVYPHTPEPTDYWRFTGETLRLLLEQTGFVDVTIVPIGGRWTAAAYLLSPFMRPHRLVAPLIYWTCLQLDSWTEKCFKLPRCPIGYVAKAKTVA